MVETSKENNKILATLNNKLLEIMNARCTIAPYLFSPLSKITNPEITSQFKLVKDFSSNRVKDLLIHNTIPVTLYDNLFLFRDTNKEIKLERDVLKMISKKLYNVDLASLSDNKLLYNFAKEMHVDKKSFR